MKRPMVTVVVAALAAATLLDSEGALAAAQEVRYPAVRVPLVDVLRPVNTVAGTLGLAAPHDALARAFGNAPIGSSDGDPNGLAAKARALESQAARRPPAPSPKPSATGSAIPYLVDGPPVPVLPAPGPGHPTRVLVTGDSMAGEPGYALTDLLASADRSDLDVRDEPYVGTGLARPDAFDWSLKAASQAASYHPDVAVVFLGENDGFPLAGAGPYSADWARLYAARVQAVVDAYQAGGVRLVIWAAPPIDAQTNPAEGGNVNAIFRNVEAAVRATVARVPATAMLDQYDLFSVGGRFAHAVPDPTTGAVVPDARLADGSHLTRAGAMIVARLLLRYLDRAQGQRDGQAEAAQRQGPAAGRSPAPEPAAGPRPVPEASPAAASAATHAAVPAVHDPRLAAEAKKAPEPPASGSEGSTKPLGLALVAVILAVIYGRDFGGGALLRRLLALQRRGPESDRPYVGARSRNTQSTEPRPLAAPKTATKSPTAGRVSEVPTRPATDANPPGRSP